MEITNILLLAFAALFYFNTCDGCSCGPTSLKSSFCQSDFVMEAKIVDFEDSYTEDVRGMPKYIAEQYTIRTYDIDIKQP